ncbi:hypothetical protein K1T71_012273, partial [Dendrolimus kikuchii]
KSTQQRLTAGVIFEKCLECSVPYLNSERVVGGSRVVRTRVLCDRASAPHCVRALLDLNLLSSASNENRMH